MSSQPVALFIPCFIDQVYPEMGLAMVSVLKRLGIAVSYNREQTCCGQPAFNAGYRDEALQVARTWMNAFSAASCVVCPSGSCTAMVRNFYSVLFAGAGEAEQRRARALGATVFEFSEFLLQSKACEKIRGQSEARIGFHHSCHSYRELHLKKQPIALFDRITGLQIIEPEPVCCGFGGLFSFKFETIAGTMAKTRLEMFEAENLHTIVSNDPGCILHLRQEAKVQGKQFEILHIAELLDRLMA